MKDDLFSKELLTQNEVAEYFRVVQGTIKNWRDQGLLSYWQAPGSTKVLYYRDEVIKFRDDNNTISKKGVDRNRHKVQAIKGKPVISDNDDDWRI